jgi:hypothetical protein
VEFYLDVELAAPIRGVDFHAGSAGQQVAGGLAAVGRE